MSITRLKALNLCRRCSLAERRHSVVIGRGKIPADVLFVGEAPGQSEDLLATPFIGRSGRLLDAMLLDVFKSVGFTPDYYITNTVLCRPCDSKNGPNRQPTEKEIFLCRSNIEFILDRVHPRLVVFLGKIPAKYCAFMHQEILALHHPAFLLRTGGFSSPAYLPMRNKLITKLKEVFQCPKS